MGRSTESRNSGEKRKHSYFPQCDDCCARGDMAAAVYGHLEERGSNSDPDGGRKHCHAVSDRNSYYGRRDGDLPAAFPQILTLRIDNNLIMHKNMC